jgi:hypothetical protein
VKKIVSYFKTLIENKGIWKEMWAGASHRPEKAAQRLFFVAADAFCEANHLDVTPEADSGNGPVDFKFSWGYHCRILVEIKLSTNSKLVSGYAKQLEAYKSAENAHKAVYVVVDVGNLKKKDEALFKMKAEWKPKNGSSSEIEFVDARKRPSASKL